MVVGKIEQLTKTTVGDIDHVKMTTKELRVAPSTKMLLALLKDLEWGGDNVHFTCPICRRDRAHGHDDDCRLAAALGA